MKRHLERSKTKQNTGDLGFFGETYRSGSQTQAAIRLIYALCY